MHGPLGPDSIYPASRLIHQSSSPPSIAEAVGVPVTILTRACLATGVVSRSSHYSPCPAHSTLMTARAAGDYPHVIHPRPAEGRR